jgi:hypothetical protein
MTATVAPVVAAETPSRHRSWHVRLAWIAAALPLSFILGWAVWFMVAWVRFGHPSASDRPDPLLDCFMPVYEVAERHEIGVAAPAAVTFDAARSLDLQRSWIVHAVFAGRERLFSHTTAPMPHLSLEQLRSIGWGLLAEAPGRELVFGAVTQPWRGDVQFRALPPATFAAFDSAGYAKIVWTLAVDSVGPAGSRFRTETRVLTTDPVSRARFRRYWALVSAGIVLIRRQAIRLVREDAERRWSPQRRP